MTVDYNAQGGIIGVEVIGSLARAGASAVLEALTSAENLDDQAEVKRLLEPVAG